MEINLLPILLVTVPIIISIIAICIVSFIVINEIKIYREYLTELKKDDEEDRDESKTT